MTTFHRETAAPRAADRTIAQQFSTAFGRKHEGGCANLSNLSETGNRLRRNAAEHRLDWLRVVKTACLSVVLLCVSSHHAFADASLCDSMKTKAAGKAAAQQLRCHSKAAITGVVDDACLENAESKLSKSIVKAEDKDDCTVSGNAGSLSSITDQFVTDIVSNGVVSAQESFFIEPFNDIAIVLPPPFPSYPAGIEVFFEPAIQNGVAVIAKVRNAQGDVIGFATELEEVDLATGISNTVWTLELPGRGQLFLSQQEDVAPLLGIALQMLATGQLAVSFDPPLEFDNTIGPGIVVGGTGEFANARGTFRELGTLYGVSLIDRPLNAQVVLAVDFE